jgi:hypothetical protein
VYRSLNVDELDKHGKDQSVRNGCSDHYVNGERWAGHVTCMGRAKKKLFFFKSPVEETDCDA